MLRSQLPKCLRVIAKIMNPKRLYQFPRGQREKLTLLGVQLIKHGGRGDAAVKSWFPGPVDTLIGFNLCCGRIGNSPDGIRARLAGYSTIKSMSCWYILDGDYVSAKF